jgi:hypothetical protein
MYGRNTRQTLEEEYNKKQMRDYKLEDGSILSKENVYFV